MKIKIKPITQAREYIEIVKQMKLLQNRKEELRKDLSLSVLQGGKDKTASTKVLALTDMEGSVTVKLTTRRITKIDAEEAENILENKQLWIEGEAYELVKKIKEDFIAELYSVGKLSNAEIQQIVKKSESYSVKVESA